VTKQKSFEHLFHTH